jgi:hypothetical protein
MKYQEIKAFALTALLIAASVSQTACEWGKVSRPLTAIGYNVQTALLAAGRTVRALAECKGGQVDGQIQAIKRVSVVTEQWSKKIDETIEINPQTKVELLGLTDSVVAEIGKTFALLKPDDTQLQQRLLVARAAISAARVTIAAIDVSQPQTPRSVKVNMEEATKQAAKAGAKNAEQNICVIDKLGVIASEFTGDILAQKGLDVAALKTLRIQQHDFIQAL